MGGQSGIDRVFLLTTDLRAVLVLERGVRSGRRVIRLQPSLSGRRLDHRRPLPSRLQSQRDRINSQKRRYRLPTREVEPLSDFASRNPRR